MKDVWCEGSFAFGNFNPVTNVGTKFLYMQIVINEDVPNLK